jgi:hypothetical protein
MLRFADKEVTVIADSVSEVCLMSARMYEDLRVAGFPTLKMPIKGDILMTAL